ncbi:MAG: redox-regulated ATPase YchF [Rhodothermales bacterium]|nr:redox-regulated ATPase YchF [Rhodothermales bacterium]
MALRCGIVGLPNVGKSTLFNALSSAGAEAANYPFCTIEPNVGVVPVPDKRQHVLAGLANSASVIPATIEFYDIAGLVEGASKGEGLGNQFLSHIREVDAIIHVVRCFDNEDVVHVSGSVDPARDIEVIETELLLKDLESLERRVDKLGKQAKSGDKKLKDELSFTEKVRDFIGEGKPGRLMHVDQDHRTWFDNLFLLTAKPVLYAANVSEADVVDGNEYTRIVAAIAAEEGAVATIVSAEVEAQIADLDEADRIEFLKDLGLGQSGLDRLVQSAYTLLGLITFFTVGPKETRAWTITRGMLAPQAAGQIHTDFEKGFIRAETIKFKDYEQYRTEAAAREAGAMRSEGKAYVVQDGDVMLFRFNV